MFIAADKRSFATGWNYFFKYVMLLPTNLTAAGLVLQYWLPNLNTAVWVTVFGVVLLALNLLHVSIYGKAQFYFVSRKPRQSALSSSKKTA